MKKNKHIAPLLLSISAVLMLVSSAFTSADFQTRVYSGTAFKAGSSQALYTENYTEQINKDGHYKFIRTEYRDMKGKVICNRSLDFNTNRYTPDYSFENHVSGYSEGVEVKGSRIHVFHKHKPGQEVEGKWLDLTPNMVIDGGFNVFVKDHWPEISQGKAVAFSFVSPIHLTSYKLRIRMDKQVTLNNKTAVIVNLEPDNFILRSLIDPVKCCYDPKSQRLMSYEGITNIQNVFSGLKNVRIVYPNLGP